MPKLRHKGLDEHGRPCCCVWALQQFDDFKNTVSAVQEVIEAAGHKCIFLPKFHPELNFIERFWGHCKRWLRKHCLYTMKGLWENFPKVFSEAVTPLSLIRKFARTSWRWMDSYRRGLPPALTAFAAKVYHGHRGIPPTLDHLVNELKEHKQKRAAVKLEKLREDCSKVTAQVRMVVDPGKVVPEKLVGLWLSKEFEGFGLYRGQIVDCDKDRLGKDIFHIRYLDGDEEDLFLREVTSCVSPDELLLHINSR